MSTTIEHSTTAKVTNAARGATGQPAGTRVQRGTVAPPAAREIDSTEFLSKRPASEITRLVFMALLGCAACIALVGVVSEAGSSGTSPDDPAPAVIVDLAD